MMGVVIVVVHVVVAIVLLTVVPIGLRLVAGPEVAALRRVWWTPAGLAVVSLWLPRGPLTGALTLPYLLLTAALPRRPRGGPRRPPASCGGPGSCGGPLVPGTPGPRSSPS